MSAAEPRTAFVTGGSGFIGGRPVLRRLAGDGWRVRALVRSDGLGPGRSRRRARIPSAETSTTPSPMRTGAEGADLTFHAAAHLGDWGTREEFERANVRNAQRRRGEQGGRRAAVRARRDRGWGCWRGSRS